MNQEKNYLIENSCKKKENRQQITLKILKRIRKGLDKELSMKDIDLDSDISLKAAYNAVDKISGGYSNEEILSKKKGRPAKKESVGKTKMSEFLLKDSSYTQKELQLELRRNGLTKSQSSISRDLKAMEYSRKRLVRIPEDRNSKKTKISGRHMEEC